MLVNMEIYFLKFFTTYYTFLLSYFSLSWTTPYALFLPPNPSYINKLKMLMIRLHNTYFHFWQRLRLSYCFHCFHCSLILRASPYSWQHFVILRKGEGGKSYSFWFHISTLSLPSSPWKYTFLDVSHVPSWIQGRDREAEREVTSEVCLESLREYLCRNLFRIPALSSC